MGLSNLGYMKKIKSVKHKIDCWNTSATPKLTDEVEIKPFESRIGSLRWKDHRPTTPVYRSTFNKENFKDTEF